MSWLCGSDLGLESIWEWKLVPTLTAVLPYLVLSGTSTQACEWTLPILSAGALESQAASVCHRQCWNLQPAKAGGVLWFPHGEAPECGYACALDNACEGRPAGGCVHVCPQSACLLCVCVYLGKICLCGSACVCWCVRIYFGLGGEMLCLGAVSTCGCMSLSIPRSVSYPCSPLVPAGMGWQWKSSPDLQRSTNRLIIIIIINY